MIALLFFIMQTDTLRIISSILFHYIKRNISMVGFLLQLTGFVIDTVH